MAVNRIVEQREDTPHPAVYGDPYMGQPVIIDQESQGMDGTAHLLKRDSLDLDARKVTIPSDESFGWQKTDTMKATAPAVEGLDKLSAGTVWGSKAPLPVEENHSKITTMGLAEESSYVTAVWDSVGSWFRRITNNLNPWATDVSIGDKELSKGPVAMNRQERVSLKKFLHDFNTLLNKLKDEMDEAALEQLMEAMLFEARNSKNEDLALRKSNMLKRQEGLRDEQIKYLKEKEAYLQTMQDNEWWSKMSDIASTLGMAAAATSFGTGWAVVAAFYVVGKTANSYNNDWIEKHAASGIATTMNHFFGSHRDNVERRAYNYIKAGCGIFVMLASVPLGLSLRGIPGMIQGATSLTQGVVQYTAERQQGEMEFRGYKLTEAQEAMSKSIKDLGKFEKSLHQLWKACARYAINSHEAKRAMVK